MSSCSERRRQLLLAALAGLSGPTLAREPEPAAASAPAALAATDPSRYQALDLAWQDAARDRPVPVRLYLPAAAADPVPLLLFSHGIGGSRRGYRYLGAWLASQGVAALHVQHVGSDRELWAGNPFTLLGRLQGAARDGEALARVQDVRFALDTLLAGPWAAQLDASRIAAAGHSYGANTTLLLAGARVLRDGVPLDLAEPRLKAAVLISAPPFYGETDLPAILGGIRLPSLHITATEDVIQIPGYRSPAADRVAVFEATGGPLKSLAVFQGGSHSVFTDRAGTGGLAANPRIKAATRELVLGFLGQAFHGRSEPVADWLGRFAPLLARWDQQPPAAAAVKPVRAT